MSNRERLSNRERNVVTPDWLIRHLGEENLQIIDVRSAASHQSERIPGAALMDVYTYLVQCTNRDGVKTMRGLVDCAFSRLDIDPSKRCVFYENVTGMAAARGLWFLEYLGYEGGAILDGGIEAWRVAGGTVEEGGELVSPICIGDTEPSTDEQDRACERSPIAASRAVAPSVRKKVLATAREILEADPEETVVLDVRNEEEYAGDAGHSCCPRSGHIPGARLFPWNKVIETGRFAPRATIRAELKKAGIRPENDVVVYCHRGARSAAAFYALRLAGYERVRNYIGSWHEWASLKEYPVARGREI